MVLITVINEALLSTKALVEQSFDLVELLLLLLLHGFNHLIHSLFLLSFLSRVSRFSFDDTFVDLINFLGELSSDFRLTFAYSFLSEFLERANVTLPRTTVILVIIRLYDIENVDIGWTVGLTSFETLELV